MITIKFFFKGQPVEVQISALAVFWLVLAIWALAHQQPLPNPAILA